MNTRLAKEARSLFPVWVLTLLLPAAPILIWGKEVIGLAAGLFCLGSAMLGATVFGAELNYRSMDLLLSQPVSRRQIWFEKMLVLEVALFSAFALFMLGLRWYYPELSANPFCTLRPFIPLCAFAATPCLTLVSRNFIGSVVFSLALPMVILLCGEAWLVTVIAPSSGLDEYAFEEAFHPRLLVYYLLGALGVYAGVTYLLGCLRFNTFEAADRPAGETSLSPVPGGAMDCLLRRIWLGPSGSYANLIRKEIRLQLPSLLTALLFSVLWAIALIIKAMRPVDVAQSLAAGGVGGPLLSDPPALLLQLSLLRTELAAALGTGSFCLPGRGSLLRFHDRFVCGSHLTRRLFPRPASQATTAAAGNQACAESVTIVTKSAHADSTDETAGYTTDGTTQARRRLLPRSTTEEWREGRAEGGRSSVYLLLGAL